MFAKLSSISLRQSTPFHTVDLRSVMFGYSISLSSYICPVIWETNSKLTKYFFFASVLASWTIDRIGEEKNDIALTKGSAFHCQCDRWIAKYGLSCLVYRKWTFLGYIMCALSKAFQNLVLHLNLDHGRGFCHHGNHLGRTLLPNCHLPAARFELPLPLPSEIRRKRSAPSNN